MGLLSAITFGVLNTNVYKDGNGKRNVELPFGVTFGKCARFLSDHNPSKTATDNQLVITIQKTGEACGFCDTSTAVTNQGVEYGFGIDPKGIALQLDTDATIIDAPVTAEIQCSDTAGSAPEGMIYNLFSANPGLCQTVATSLRSIMHEDLSREFDAKTMASFAINVTIASGSDACPNLATAQATQISTPSSVQGQDTTPITVFQNIP